MKITPLEIRQKTFDRTLRGYDKDDVNAFLLSLSQEWEKNIEEIKNLKSRYEKAEKEVVRLRDAESTLFKTLKTVEDTGANTIEQAHKAAELLLRESQITADALTNEARVKAKNTIEEAEVNGKQILVEAEEKFKSLVHYYKVLETYRNNLIGDLKRLAGEMLERADRALLDSQNLRVDDLYQDPLNRSINQVLEKKQNFQKEAVTIAQRSFFDEVA